MVSKSSGPSTVSYCPQHAMLTARHVNGLSPYNATPDYAHNAEKINTALIKKTPRVNLYFIKQLIAEIRNNTSRA